MQHPRPAPDGDSARPTASLRIGEFLFDPGSGELEPWTSAGPEAAVGHRQDERRRLPPQPARLLALLAERGGEVVSREEIREVLWPDVQVDFDQGLHFCVRQLRAALGDSPDRPRYIETLPRRGYRLIASVELLVEPLAAALAPGSETSSAKKGTRRLLVASAALVAALAAVLGVLQLASIGSRGPEPSNGATPILAIMPFQPTLGSDGDGARDVALLNAPAIAERLLERLGRLGPRQLAVIGPATTALYRSDLGDVARLIDDLGVDYVVNGRFSTTGDATVLVELIRGLDGVHVWVERFDLPATEAEAQEIARSIGDAVLETLDLQEEP